MWAKTRDVHYTREHAVHGKMWVRGMGVNIGNSLSDHIRGFEGFEHTILVDDAGCSEEEEDRAI